MTDCKSYKVFTDNRLKPVNCKAEPFAGMVKLSFDAIPDVRSYRYEYRVRGADDWTVLIFSQTDRLITGLEPGAVYEFRIAGVIYGAERVYSDTLTVPVG